MLLKVVGSEDVFANSILWEQAVWIVHPSKPLNDPRQMVYLFRALGLEGKDARLDVWEVTDVATKAKGRRIDLSATPEALRLPNGASIYISFSTGDGTTSDRAALAEEPSQASEPSRQGPIPALDSSSKSSTHRSVTIPSSEDVEMPKQCAQTGLPLVAAPPPLDGTFKGKNMVFIGEIDKISHRGHRKRKVLYLTPFRVVVAEPSGAIERYIEARAVTEALTQFTEMGLVRKEQALEVLLKTPSEPPDLLFRIAQAPKACSHHHPSDLLELLARILRCQGIDLPYRMIAAGEKLLPLANLSRRRQSGFSSSASESLNSVRERSVSPESTTTPPAQSISPHETPPTPVSPTSHSQPPIPPCEPPVPDSPVMGDREQEVKVLSRPPLRPVGQQDHTNSSNGQVRVEEDPVEEEAKGDSPQPQPKHVETQHSMVPKNSSGSTDRSGGAFKVARQETLRAPSPLRGHDMEPKKKGEDQQGEGGRQDTKPVIRHLVVQRRDAATQSTEVVQAPWNAPSSPTSKETVDELRSALRSKSQQLEECKAQLRSATDEATKLQLQLSEMMQGRMAQEATVKAQQDELAALRASNEDLKVRNRDLLRQLKSNKAELLSCHTRIQSLFSDIERVGAAVTVRDEKTRKWKEECLRRDLCHKDALKDLQLALHTKDKTIQALQHEVRSLTTFHSHSQSPSRLVDYKGGSPSPTSPSPLLRSSTQGERGVSQTKDDHWVMGL